MTCLCKTLVKIVAYRTEEVRKWLSYLSWLFFIVNLTRLRTATEIEKHAFGFLGYSISSKNNRQRKSCIYQNLHGIKWWELRESKLNAGFSNYLLIDHPMIGTSFLCISSLKNRRTLQKPKFWAKIPTTFYMYCFNRYLVTIIFKITKILMLEIIMSSH